MDFITPSIGLTPDEHDPIGSTTSGGVIIETPGGIIVVFPDGTKYTVDEFGNLIPVPNP